MNKSLGCICVLALAGMDAGAVPARELQVFVGTYSRNGSEGIYTMRMDADTGSLTAPELAAKADNPSFLALHPSGRFLYAVSETGRYQGQPSGAVAAFAVDPATSRLTELNRQPTGGAAPCHLAVDATGRALVIANYADGTVASFPIAGDGTLGALVSKIPHAGTGPNAQRQKGPHAHGVTFDASNRYAFIPDLGIDRIMIYKLDAPTAKLTPHDPAFAALPPGAGPRHFAFHPSKALAWSINELDSTVTTFAWDARSGTLERRESVSTLPPGGTNRSTTAEIAVHPSGRFLYGSNRGHDSIAVFAIDGATGRLSPVQHQATGGRTPRSFALDSSGRFLLAANQDSGNIVVFRVDPDTGRLAPAGHEARVALPVCVLFR